VTQTYQETDTAAKVAKKLTKTPQTAAQIAAKLGYKGGSALNRPLGDLVRRGVAVRSLNKDGKVVYAKVVS
jgi:hypothetical protein